MITLSASAIKRFQSCPRVWWISKYTQMRVRPYSAMILGIMSHNLIEAQIRGEKYDVSSDIQSMIARLAPEDAKELNKQIKSGVLDSLKEASDKIKKTVGTPISVEKYFSIDKKLKNETIKLEGYLDIIGEDKNIYDLKVGLQCWSDSTYLMNKYWLQSEIYKMASESVGANPKVYILSVGLKTGKVSETEMKDIPGDIVERTIARAVAQMRWQDQTSYNVDSGLCEVCGQLHEFYHRDEKDEAFTKTHRKNQDKARPT